MLMENSLTAPTPSLPQDTLLDLKKVFNQASVVLRRGQETCGEVIDGSQWAKVLRKGGVLGSGVDRLGFTLCDADMVFAKVKVRGERKIGFKQFVRALEHLAKRNKTLSLETLAGKLTNGVADYAATAPTQHTSKVSSLERLEHIQGPERFFYDKNTYTIAAKIPRGSEGPSLPKNPTMTTGGVVDLAKLCDRSKAVEVDIRGVAKPVSKKSLAAPHREPSSARTPGAKSARSTRPAKEENEKEDSLKIRGPERFFYDASTFTGSAKFDPDRRRRLTTCHSNKEPSAEKKVKAKGSRRVTTAGARPSQARMHTNALEKRVSEAAAAVARERAEATRRRLEELAFAPSNRSKFMQSVPLEIGSLGETFGEKGGNWKGQITIWKEGHEAPRPQPTGPELEKQVIAALKRQGLAKSDQAELVIPGEIPVPDSKSMPSISTLPATKGGDPFSSSSSALFPGLPQFRPPVALNMQAVLNESRHSDPRLKRMEQAQPDQSESL